MLDAGPLVISELMAVNDTGLQDEDGDFSDWIEIHNAGSEPAELAGWHLTDDASVLDKWTFPAQAIGSDEYLVVFASGKDRVGSGPNGEHHANFSLEASGEYLALVRDDGEIASQFAPAYPRQRRDVSYGTGQTLVDVVTRGADATVLVPSDDSLGRGWTGNAADEPFDDSPAAGWIAATTGVGFDADGSPIGGGEPFGQDVIDRASLDGWHGTAVFNTPFPNDGGGTTTISGWQFYNGASAAAGRQLTPLLVEYVGSNYLVRGIGATRTADASGVQAYPFAVQSGTDAFDPSAGSFHMAIRYGTPTISNRGVVEFDSGATSWAFYGGPGSVSGTHNIVVSNPVTGPNALSSLGREYSVQFLLGGSGFAPLLGDGSAALESAMRGNNASAYVRIQFELELAAPFPATGYHSLLLRMKYDDGFVAYVNGVVVARRNAPPSVTFDSAAASDRPRTAAAEFEDFDLTAYLGSLRDGTNLLAIQGLNDSAASAEFLILPELSVGTTSAQRYLAMATPGTANVSGVIDFVADTTFSVDRGFFVDPFYVDVTTATPGATIVYTTNGSTPTLSNGIRVLAPDPNSPPVATVHVTGTTTLRAAAFRDDYQPTNVDTHTYLFVADVTQQGVISSTIRNHPVWGPQLQDSLLAVPTISLVTPNSISLTERETSVELIFPDGTEGFQVDAGVEHFGGHSLGYPKKSMRISFKKIYGPARLNYDLFGGDATDEFDQFLLRSGSHDTMFYTNGTRGIYIRNRWISNAQLEMGQPAPRGQFVHVYINGTYWGQFQLMERPNAALMASYFGGDKEDYDALNAGTPVDGNLAAWNAMANAAGNYAALQQYMDVVNYADYMITQFYSGNDWDWNHYQNWMAARKREAGAGYQFFAWDSDMVLRRGLNANVINRGGPGNLWGTIKQHEEFRILLADRAQKHFFNNGILTPGRVLGDFRELADLIETSIIAETARWGASQSYTPATWQSNLNTVRTQIIAGRTAVVVQQMRAAGVFPSIDAPTFNQHGGLVDPGFELTISAPSGTIYYTLDGSDPRLPGGQVSPTARTYDGTPIPIDRLTQAKARVLRAGEWSALSEARFFIHPPADADSLAIAEINYRPHDADTAAGELNVDNDQFEFIELLNTSQETIDLTDVRFTRGITFNFTEGSVPTLDAGDRVLVVRDRPAFESRYGSGLNVAGEFDVETGLSNGGERLRLVDADGEDVLDFSYDDEGAWPGRADGKGASLEVVDPELFNTGGGYGDPGNWSSSRAYGGTPGAEPLSQVGIVVNEVFSHTDPPLLDAIELYNPTDTDVDVGDWYLSDSWGWGSSAANGNYKKFRIPEGTTIPAGGYLVFDEKDFNPFGGADPELHPYDFALSGARGDDVWLMEADAAGRLTRFVDHVKFGAAAHGESFGRWPNGQGGLYPMTMRTLGHANSGPRIGPVVITEVMYHPPVGDDEFVELYNPTGATVPLYDSAHPSNTWQLEGVQFSFPEGATIPAGGVALVVPIEPGTFRAKYGISIETQVFGPYDGALNNAGERFQLLSPDEPEAETGLVPYLLVDEVNYDKLAPWPVDADGSGDSLQRRGSTLFGNDWASWTAAPPTPGTVPLTPQIAGRYVFYNHSIYDGNQAAAGPRDDDAMAPDKQALLPGTTATFANYTNYSRGINGIMVDIADSVGTPTVDDFRFKLGNNSFPASWELAPAPASVTVRPGAGTNGSDRVTIIWADHAIEKEWLEVAVLSTGNTGLPGNDVFYFGNAIGESGDSAGDAKVNAFDMLGARDNQRNFLNPAPIDFEYDFDRSARVDAVDMLIARNNPTHFLNALRLITVPAAKNTANSGSVAAHDAVFQQAVKPEPGSFSLLKDLSGASNWLREYDHVVPGSQPAAKVRPAEAARRKGVDTWLSVLYTEAMESM